MPVGERHHQVAADPRLDVLGGQVGLRAAASGRAAAARPVAGAAVAERRRAALLVGVHRRLDRDLDQLGAEVGGDRPRVGLGLGAGVGGGHDDAADALGAERVGGDQRDQRRVDPAREGDADVLEAVLARRSRAGRASAPRRPRRPAPAARRGGSTCRSARARAGEHGRPSAAASPVSARSLGRARGRRPAAPPRTGRRGRASRRRASTTTLWPSKTSSSWPPTRLQKANAGAGLAGALGEHRSRSRALAAVVGRARGVDDQPGARPAPRPRPAGPGTRCPRRSSARRAPRRPRSAPACRRARSSAARRRRRSSAAGSCGRRRGPAPSASTATELWRGGVALREADQGDDRPRPRRRAPRRLRRAASRKCGFSHRSSAG